MGLTKQYLRYVSSAVFGVIGSQKANIAYVTLRGGEKGRYVAVAACEHVFIWDVRKAEKVLILQGQKHEVTFLCPSPDGVHIAVGYEDGAVRIFSLLNGESTVSFNGHKSAVTVINYDALGARLVTGSKDTDVIVWDVINECGLYRLKGHKDVITQALFLKKKNLLVTSSKDSFVKWWDLDTQHCFKTMVGHRSEVWGMLLLNQEDRLLTGSADSELRAWNISYLEEGKADGEPRVKKEKTLLEDDEDEDEEVDESPEERILSCKKFGSILREARDRVVSLTADNKARVIACHVSNETSPGSIKLSRIHDKMSAEEPVVERMLKDEIIRLTNIKASAKIRWVDCLSCAGGELKVALLLQNNTIETYSLRTLNNTPTANKTARLTLGGHRTDVRTLAFSSDNLAVLSASGDTVKVWNRSTLQVIRTMACEYALCSLFVPGDRQIILGTKSGKLQIFELASGSLLETVDAHDGAVWSLCLAPDQRGIVTGSADKTVKFWEFELIKDQGTWSIQEMFCDIVDSTLIATGSADRNVKIWGLDFGDCHRSMFAHDDSVMFLQFVPKTHLFFTAGKDKKIKQWDADKFEHIQTLEGHHREVWCLTISPSGDYIVSSGHDKSLRLWERTREPIILEEEREMEREAEVEESMAKGDVPVVPGETQGEAAPAGKKTVETVKAAERIMEVLELYREETRKMEEHKYACEKAGKELPPPQSNPILVAFGNVSTSSPCLFIKIHSVCFFLVCLPACVVILSELEVSLLVLPFPYIPELLTLFNSYIQQGLEVELVCRCLFFLVSNIQWSPLQFLQREIESKEDVMFFADATGRLDEKKKKKRKRERAVLTIA
uniref:Uncharacterized protein n=1 Tax=Sphaeramia orbicularis TaxID=375764 RepID=A0A673BEL8_9TELE